MRTGDSFTEANHAAPSDLSRVSGGEESTTTDATRRACRMNWPPPLNMPLSQDKHHLSFTR